MKNNEVKLKLIKDTVISSILSEMHDELLKKGVGSKKASELERITKPRLVTILNSLEERVLLPTQEIESQEDFQNHILKVINLAKGKLRTEIQKETS